MTVVTRFAPSPTGFLHIGGARTALFNYLFARHVGGRYLLRIEDTDRARSTPEAVAAIQDGLDWLGLSGDEQTVYQFARASRHREVAEAMVARGAAFRCYVTPEELEVRRDAAAAVRDRLKTLIAANGSPNEIAELRAEVERLTAPFRSPYRDGLKPPSPAAPSVIRLRAPDVGEIVNDDLVQGPVHVAARDIDDMVLLRADGAPTYMLAVVVDDHDMSVTHVIRGDDHLTNAARQIPLFAAMDWPVPAYAHIPLIHGPDGAKLSKRHGALGVSAYRDLGYLPEGLCNYLLRLGWSHGDAEIISMDEAIAWFDLAHVGRAPARLDFAKLDSVNAHYMRQADDRRLLRLLLDYPAIAKAGPFDAIKASRLAAATPLLKHRAKTVAELANQAIFLIATRPLPLDDSGERLMKDGGVERLRRLHTALCSETVWDHSSLDAALKRFAAAEGVGLGKIGPVLRAVLTGGTPAPDLPSVLALLGREEALGRIEDRI
jgi:glutamyl-tRNA synthetase